MEFRRIDDTTTEVFQRAFDLYRMSFPEHEQRNRGDQERALENANYYFETIWEGDTFVGLIFYWKFDGYCYVEHFAIDTSLRGQQFGTRSLERFCKLHDKIILEIDPPVDEIAINRKRFYEHLGFKSNDYDYVHPAYRKQYAPHHLIIMSYKETLELHEYEHFVSYLKNEIMIYAENRSI